MKNYLKFRNLSTAAILFSLFCTLSLFGFLSVKKTEAKAAPLSLADVLTGLRSKKTTLAQRNKLLTAAVKERGVTFSLTAEIEKELKTAGANDVLLQAIREKNPKQNVKPSSVMNSFRVEHNVSVGGKKGMLIIPNFTVYNLQNRNLEFNILVETNDGKPLKAISSAYSSTKGNLIIGKDFTPFSDAATYGNLRLFLPYQEIGLFAGTYNLRLNPYLIYDDGTLIARFEHYYFQFQSN